MKSSYKKTVSSPNFYINTEIAHFDHGTLPTYKSSNPSVVKAVKGSNGWYFKVGKPGTATITYSIKETKNNHSASSKTKVTVAPNKIAGLKVSKKGKTSATIKWKKNSSSRGYTIQYATDKKFKKNKKTIKVKSYKQTSKAIKKLKRNKKYYVRICATTTNINSGWSKTVTFKTKK